MKQHKAAQEDIKSINKKLVFRTIAEEAPISRAGIKKRTNLAATTVSNLVDEYIEQGLLYESGLTQTNAVGRRSMMLTLNRDGGFFLVLEVRKDHVASFVFDLQLGQRQTFSMRYTSESELYPLLILAIKQVKEAYPALLSAVVALPALLHTGQGSAASSVLGFAVNWGELHTIRKQFEDIQVMFCNTSGLAAYAQTVRYPQVEHLISVDVSDGVGSGIIIDGAIYQGKNGLAGEFGHICMDIHGERCLCGGRGCLEQYISIPAILDRIYCCTGSAVSLKEAVSLFQNGNGPVVDVMTSVAGRMALALNTVANLFDPELVVISGEICLFGELFYHLVTDRLRELSLLGTNRDVRFVNTEEDLVAIGGANFLFDSYFE